MQKEFTFGSSPLSVSEILVALLVAFTVADNFSGNYLGRIQNDLRNDTGLTHSSVARGAKGAVAPYWPEEYAKYPVFSTIETNFCTKNKNSFPPPLGVGDKNWSNT